MDSFNALDNPFSTRHIRPGAMPFLFPSGQTLEGLLDRLRQNDWRGEIVGRHGSGKSSLLASLLPSIEFTGRTVAFVELHDGQRRLPLDLRADARLHPPAILAIDGFEQLSRWQRWSIRRFCRRRSLGLVVTSHASVGLPPLYQTQVGPQLAERVVAELLGRRPWPVSREQLGRLLARHDGDLRETLFALYDFCEEKSSSSPGKIT
ncbi:MAG: hypothetical protein LLF97_10285 [Planctomycetaceae bacterium]|nr:hypothetical protein [Planctomycetaceae bacterium]